MKQIHIMDAVVDSILQKIYEEWKHEGGVLGYTSERINFEVDNKEYVLIIREILEGENFSQMRIKKDGESE